MMRLTFVNPYEVRSIGELVSCQPVARPSDFIEHHELGINRPNPFDRLTTISFALARREHMELEVMDIAGRRVATIASGEYAAGHHDVIWDGRDERGGLVSAGVYVYRLRAGTTVRSRKLLLRP